jgi:hypothetical protein
LFQPHKGVENPIIRRAMDLCEESGMRVTYHEDSVEVWFAPNNKRFYTIWSQFLADAEKIFGDRMHDQAKPAANGKGGFGSKVERGADAPVMTAARPAAAAAAAPAPKPNGDASPYDDLAKLKAEMKVLERAIRVVGMQREEWKREAEGLKEQLENVRVEATQIAEARLNQAGSGGDRYKQVRQIIVRRLHPDIPGSDEEKAYREKMFKTIWSEIEVLDRK